MSILTKETTAFPYGTIDTVDAQSIPRGAASKSKNWLSFGDRIELRRGMALLGTENVGSGGILGTHVAYKNDGTQILFRKNGRKLEYYNTATQDWAECGSNLFPAAAAADEAAFANYASLAGAQMFVCTPNSGPFKIMTANPGSYTDLTDAAINFQGYIKIKQNRMFLWGRLKDKTGVYGSYIDNAQYTTVTAENRHNGDGSTKTFTGTLAFKGTAVRTCFGVTFTDGTETFTDNYDGTLTGSAGGTGTINYTTGNYSITFNTAPIVGVNNITATYQWENSNNQGVTDFTKSAPRTAGQGFVFRQDDGGGAVQNVLSYGDVEYCMHEFKTWALTLTSTDTEATNLIYRDRVGIPNRQAAVETGSGIYYVDYTDETDPQFRLLTLDPLSAQVIPKSVSKNRKLDDELVGMDLSSYRFDKACVREWGDLITFGIRSKDATENDTLVTFNKVSGALDKHDVPAGSLVNYNGTLVIGDSASNNCYTVFSGFDDDDSLISNYWEGNLDDLDLKNLKKTRLLPVQGLIQASQGLKVSLSLDNGDFTEIATITGDGSYVDAGNPFLVGTETMGSHVVGDGGDGISAFNYEYAMRVRLDKFAKAKIRFEALGIGYVSVNRYAHFDIKTYAIKPLKKYK